MIKLQSVKCVSLLDSDLSCARGLRL